MRDVATRFEEAGVQLFGISTDDVKSIEGFAKAQKLNFPLLSDANGSVARAYRILMEERPFAQRVSFVLDEKGILRAIDRGVKVDSHGEDLIELVRGLRAK